MRPPLIILTPMRSFSSVVCAMLGQHPQAYGLPEVNLFIADTVGELMGLHQARPHGMHGLLRVLAQVHDGEQTDSGVDEALLWLDDHRGWTTRQVFDHILDAIGDRVAVDKSPRTVLSPQYLERAYRMYPEASFLHLTRHPRSTGKSLIANLEKNAEWGGTFRADRVDPEKIWLRAHQNVLNFAATLPPGQCMRIKGEDLLSQPDVYLPQIAEWLDIDPGPEALEAMMHPERSPFSCLGPEGAKYGNDPDFLENPVLRPGRVTQPNLGDPLDWAPERGFEKTTLKIARLMGYA